MHGGTASDVRQMIAESKAARARLRCPATIVQDAGIDLRRKKPAPHNRPRPVLLVQSFPLPMRETCALLLEYVECKWPQRYKPPIERIIDLVAEHYHLRPARIIGQERARLIVRPRQIGMYVARMVTGASTLSIGRAFHKDHTSVMHAVWRVENLVETDPNIAEAVAIITRRATA